ncbi:uncharacterized protein LOC122092414 [Macadamia integrifolia]|uniref:uncharacterized protein LOC122092414 n=1 Tax=Macadamia integrifolia TaxID=60698 RepID=UPI001C528981|nr:uncharacterized protein LOC122092414 [Macadamia integrifolia]
MKLARAKLVEAARDWWTTYEYELEDRGREPTSWEEMKLELLDKYLPRNFGACIQDQLNSLRQGSMTVTEYMNRFDALCSRTGISENERQLLSRFRLGLRAEINSGIRVVDVYSVRDCFDKALRAEELVAQPVRRFGFQAGEVRKNVPATKPSSSTPPKSTFPPRANHKGKAPMTCSNKAQCFHCEEVGHFTKSCPHKQRVNALAEVEDSNEEDELDLYPYPFDDDDDGGYDYDIEDSNDDGTYVIHVISNVLVAETMEEHSTEAFYIEESIVDKTKAVEDEVVIERTPQQVFEIHDEKEKFVPILDEKVTNIDDSIHTTFTVGIDSEVEHIDSMP